jgi:hypothetical protein
LPENFPVKRNRRPARSLTKSTRPAVTEPLERRSLLSAAVSFASHVDITVGNAPIAVAAGDFTNNGDQDLAVADDVNHTVTILLGNGAGGFTQGAVLTLSAPPTQIITGDFNGDGKPDLAVASSPGNSNVGTTVTVFLNEGSDTWSLGQATTIETGVGTTEPIQIAAGNFNGDGNLDIVATEYSNSAIAFLGGTGTGTFATPVTYSVAAAPTSITVGDFNGDGNEDVAVAEGSEVAVLNGSGTGTFTAGSQTSITGTGATAIATVFLSGDTKPDLAVGSSDGTVSLLTNGGSSFTVTSTAVAGGGITGLATADFNLDGLQDVAAVDGGTTFLPGADDVSVVTGATGGTNGGVTNFPTGSYPQGIAVADFNNDGKPDIAAVNEGAGTVSILLNNTAVTPIIVKNTVTLSSASTPAGSPVVITSTLVPASVSPVAGETTPTGTVDFYDGSVLLGSETIAAGASSASFTTTSLSVGIHDLSATYRGDTVYAAQHGVFVAETITPTAGDTPILVASIVSDTLPGTVAPGTSGVLKIRISNAGNATAQGTLTNNVYLSLDQTLDTNDQLVVVKGSLASDRINLAPNRSILLSGTFTVPVGFTTGLYYPLIYTDPTSTFTVGTSTEVVVANATSVVPEFGSVGGKSRVRFTLTGLGTGSQTAVFSLSGPGTGTVETGDDGIDLTLSGTTARSAVTITTTGGAVSFDDITAASAVGSITALTGNFTGTLSLSGGVATLRVASLTGSTLDIGAGAISALSLGSVTNTTLTDGGGIKSLAISDWTGGSLSAAYDNSIATKGNFTPAVSLSGSGAPRGVALGTAAISGTVDTSDWIVTGSANSITIGTVPAGWDASISGAVRSFATVGGFAGDIAAAAFSSVLIRGDLTGTILAGANFGADGIPGGTDDSYVAGSIGSVRVNGAATGAVVGAGVTPVTGGYSVLAGGSIKAITVVGAVDSTSRFLAATLPAKVKFGGVTIVPSSDPRFVGVAD